MGKLLHLIISRCYA